MLVQTIIFNYYDKEGTRRQWQAEARFKEDLAEAFYQEVETEEDFDELASIEEMEDWHEI